MNIKSHVVIVKCRVCMPKYLSCFSCLVHFGTKHKTADNKFIYTCIYEPRENIKGI